MRDHASPTHTATAPSKSKGKKKLARIEVIPGDNGGYQVEKRFRWSNKDEYDMSPPTERDMYSDAKDALAQVEECMEEYGGGEEKT